MKQWAAWAALAVAVGTAGFQVVEATREPAPTLPPLYDDMLTKRLAASEKRIGELEMSREVIAMELERLRNKSAPPVAPDLADLRVRDRVHRLEQQMRDLCIQTNGRLCP